MREICERTGYKADRVRQMLYRYHGEGRLRVANEMRACLTGTLHSTPVYWIEE